MMLPKTSSNPQEYSALPSIDSTRRHIAATITVQAIAQLEDAHRRYIDAMERAKGDGTLERFTNIAWGSYSEASQTLVNAILAWGNRDEAWEHEHAYKHLQEPRGVIHGKRLYMAMLDAADDLPLPKDFEAARGKEGETGTVMHLRILDLGDVEDLNAILGETGGATAQAITEVAPRGPEVPPPGPTDDPEPEVRPDPPGHDGPTITVVEECYELYRTSRPIDTLDHIITVEMESFRPGTWDRAIWQDGRLMAVVRSGPDRKPELVRFDNRTDPDGIAAASEASARVNQRLQARPAWVATTLDREFRMLSNRLSLDEAIADLCEDWRSGEGDLVLWKAEAVGALLVDVGSEAPRVMKVARTAAE